MKRTSLVFIIVSALVIIGVVFYLSRPRPEETDNAQLRQAAATPPAVVESPNTSSALISCTGPSNSQVSIATLDARHKWAQSLLQTNHVDGALTELRNIAALNPGYPAINLELSEALLKAKRAPEAKDAIKLQINISECLASLPQTEVQTYCKAEWGSEPQGGCAPEVARISQQAHYEAGLIDASLAHNPERPAPAPAATPSRPRIVPSAGVSAVPAAPQVAVAKVPTDPPAPKPLPPINIKSTEAAEHVGELATVCGAVVSKHTAEDSNGKPTFINLDRPMSGPTFTVVIWGADAPAVGEVPASGNICVTGKVATYRGNPQIVLRDSKSWSPR